MTDNLKYIPVKDPGGLKDIFPNSFLSMVTRAFSRGEKAYFTVALVMFTAVKDVGTSNDNTLRIAFQHLQGKAGPRLRAGPQSSCQLHFLLNKISDHSS